mgnify:CR=1 FL=1
MITDNQSNNNNNTDLKSEGYAQKDHVKCSQTFKSEESADVPDNTEDEVDEEFEAQIGGEAEESLQAFETIESLSQGIPCASESVMDALTRVLPQSEEKVMCSICSSYFEPIDGLKKEMQAIRDSNLKNTNPAFFHSEMMKLGVRIKRAKQRNFRMEYARRMVPKNAEEFCSDLQKFEYKQKKLYRSKKYRQAHPKEESTFTFPDYPEYDADVKININDDDFEAQINDGISKESISSSSTPTNSSEAESKIEKEAVAVENIQPVKSKNPCPSTKHELYTLVNDVLCKKCEIKIPHTILNSWQPQTDLPFTSKNVNDKPFNTFFLFWFDTKLRLYKPVDPESNDFKVHHRDNCVTWHNKRYQATKVIDVPIFLNGEYLYSTPRLHFFVKGRYYIVPSKKEFPMIEKLFPGCFISYDMYLTKAHKFEQSDRKHYQPEPIF